MTQAKATRHAMAQATILVVEDEVRAQRLLRLNLEPLGYQVVTHGVAQGIPEIIDSYDPALVLLDLKLPDGNGFEVCQHIRSRSPVPIIILSAFDQPNDKVYGFAVGADDYVTKPFDPQELAARIEAVLRRVQGRSLHQPTLFHCGTLTIDFEQRLVTLDGNEVALSRTEYRLLDYLARNAGRVLVADALLTRVWGPEYIGDYASLHLYISRLRRKLGDGAHNPRYIVTKPGIGYMMPADPENVAR